MPLLRVVCFRHGESAANAGLVTSNPADIPLTDVGEQQAHEISQRLTDPPAIVVCSPFLRAQQTAAPTLRKFTSVSRDTWPIQEFTYLSPVICAHTSMQQRQTWVSAYWEASNPTYVDGLGAESFHIFIERVRTSLNRFLKLPSTPDHSIVVFGHGQFLQAMRWLIQDDRKSIDADAMRTFRAIDRAIRDTGIANCLAPHALPKAAHPDVGSDPRSPRHACHPAGPAR